MHAAGASLLAEPSVHPRAMLKNSHTICFFNSPYPAMMRVGSLRARTVVVLETAFFTGHFASIADKRGAR